MSLEKKIHMNWDRLGDVMYIIREGYVSDDLINMDSSKVPGVVKRIDPETRQCVGFIITSYSYRFKAYLNLPEEQIKSLWDMSLDFTNETNVVSV